MNHGKSQLNTLQRLSTHQLCPASHLQVSFNLTRSHSALKLCLHRGAASARKPPHPRGGGCSIRPATAERDGPKEPSGDATPLGATAKPTKARPLPRRSPAVATPTEGREGRRCLSSGGPEETGGKRTRLNERDPS
ncbi:unnamed protein product [Arctogadus glacialis]